VQRVDSRWGGSMGEEEDLEDGWGGQSRGRDGGRRGVRGRWRKKAKDIMPNKKADGRFECVAQRGRPMLVGACSFLSRPRILIPCGPSAVPPPSESERRHGPGFHALSTRHRGERKKEIPIAIIFRELTRAGPWARGPDG
jgi:hypothetical protein